MALVKSSIKPTFIKSVCIAILSISSSWLQAATPVEQRVVGDDSYPYYGAQPSDQDTSRNSYGSSSYNSNQGYGSNSSSSSSSYNSNQSYDPNRDYQQNSNSYNSSSNGGSTGDPMWDILNQIERLQSQVAQLNGLVDKQAYEIQQLQKQQKQHYVDLDQRIEALGGQPGAMNSNASSSPTNNAKAQLSDLEIKSTYDKAINLVKAKEYQSAEQSFRRILDEGGQSFYVPFAHYWLGEVLLAKNNPDVNQAKQHFETLVRDYSNHSKVAPSLYKLGTLYNVQGDSQKAIDMLNQVIKEYPGTTEANRARQYLEQVK